MSGTVAFAFLVGTLTTLNPCGFVLLPAYFARRLQGDGVNPVSRLDAVRQALKVGVVTSFGIVFVFGVVGAAISFGAYWLNDVVPWAGFAIGIALMVAGLFVLAGKRINAHLTLRGKFGANLTPGLAGDLSYGMGYGIVSLSCMLPVFVTVMGVSLGGSLATHIVDFVAYVLGVATILTGLSVSAAFARDGLATFLKRLLPYTYRVSGAFLFFAGFYVAYLWGSAIFQVQGPGMAMLAAGEVFSGALRTWISGQVVQWSMLAVLCVLIAISVWTLIGRRSERQKNHKASVTDHQDDVQSHL